MSQRPAGLTASAGRGSSLTRVLQRITAAGTIPSALAIGGLLLLSWALTLAAGGTEPVPPGWFLVPVVLAAARFGSAGVVVTAVVAGALAGPLAPADAVRGELQPLSAAVSRLMFFLVIGEVAVAVLRPRQVTRRPSGELKHQPPAWRPVEAAADGDGLDRRRDRIRALLATRNVRTDFQPIVDLRTGELAGVEALSRFPVVPIQPPDLWVAQAWELGLGPDLEILLAEVALERAASLPRGCYVSINLSPETLVTGRARHLLDGLPPGRLVIEMTEHVAVEDYDRLTEEIAWLRQAGARLAIDDVGAGFASLRHVLRLYPDIVKLDVGLVQDIEGDPARHALARGIRACAGELRATVVAEGVETEDALRLLRDLDVGCGQGYHLGRPSPLADILDAPLARTADGLST